MSKSSQRNQSAYSEGKRDGKSLSHPKWTNRPNMGSYMRGFNESNPDWKRNQSVHKNTIPFWLRVYGIIWYCAPVGIIALLVWCVYKSLSN